MNVACRALMKHQGLMRLFVADDFFFFLNCVSDEVWCLEDCKNKLEIFVDNCLVYD